MSNELRKDIHICTRVASYLGKWERLWFITCSIFSGFATFALFSMTGILMEQLMLLVETGSSSIGISDSVIYIVGILIIIIVQGLSDTSFTILEMRARRRMERDALNSWYHIDNSRIPWTEDEFTARINRNIRGAADLVSINMVGMVFGPFLSGLFSLIFLFSVDWRIGALSTMLGFLYLMVASIGLKTLRRKSGELEKNKAGVASVFSDDLDGALEVRSFSLASMFNRKMDKVLNDYRITDLSMSRIQIVRNLCSGMFWSIGTISLLSLGWYLSVRGLMPFATVMLAFPLVDQIAQFFNSFSSFFLLLSLRAPHAERVFEIIDVEREQEGAIGHIPVGSIAFKDVRFSYDENVDVLKGIDLSIPCGCKVAFVGESGSGKSTALKLIAGQYLPDSGSMIMGNCNISEARRYAWRKNISYVPQDTVLLNASIAENVSLSEERDANRIVEAIGCAALSKVVLSKKDQYEYVLSGDDYGISGGEAQRISIARAFYRDTPVILMDEPTSALDAESRKAVKDYIVNIPRDKTVVVVTHQLEMIVDFDLIYVFNNGTIIEKGSHDELVSANGYYAELWNRQNQM